MPIQLNQHLSETFSTNTEPYNIHDGRIYYRAVVSNCISLSEVYIINLNVFFPKLYKPTIPLVSYLCDFIYSRMLCLGLPPPHICRVPKIIITNSCAIYHLQSSSL